MFKFWKKSPKQCFLEPDSFGIDNKKPPRNFFRGGTVCYRVGRGFRQELLAELLELVSDELDLGSDDDLNGGLTGTDNASSAGGLDDLLVNQQTVLDFQSQTGDCPVQPCLPPRHFACCNG